MRFYLASVLILTFIFQTTQAQIKYSCEKWEVFDIVIEQKLKITNPFEVDLLGILIHENGRNTQVPGFYDGNNRWVIRFCPDIEGKWSLVTSSSEKKLDARRAVLQVKPNTRKDEHGPVRVSKKYPNRFEYADGTPYFSMAFEVDWLFAPDAENEAGIPKTRKLIESLKANNFNQVVMNVYAFDADWGERDKIEPENNYAKPEVFPFLGSNENPDYSSLNLTFFQRFDRIMELLDEQEIISHLMIYVWNKKVNWPEPESKADQLYFDYVVKRYQAYPNLIWDISKEALAYGHDDMDYITQKIRQLRRLDGHNRLVTVHDYLYCDNYPQNVDFISIQEWKPNLYNSMLKVTQKHKDKPVINIEHGGYEKTMHSIFDGAYTDPVACLDRNYQCIFTGSYSTYYWQNSSWYELVTEPFSLPEEQQPHFHYYKHLVDLFTEYDFTELKPGQGFFTTYYLSNQKGLYLFYQTPGMEGIHGELAELTGKKVKYRWFDPLTGRYSEYSNRDFHNSKWIGIKKDPAISGPVGILIMEVEK